MAIFLRQDIRIRNLEQFKAALGFVLLLWTRHKLHGFGRFSCDRFYFRRNAQLLPRNTYHFMSGPLRILQLSIIPCNTHKSTGKWLGTGKIYYC